jgi:hypothetical protein
MDKETVVVDLDNETFLEADATNDSDGSHQDDKKQSKTSQDNSKITHEENIPSYLVPVLIKINP